MKSATFAALRLVIFTAICFLVAGRAFAQTTTNYSVIPTSCQTFAANAHCTFPIATPDGNANFFYEPAYNGRFNVVEFDAPLDSLGFADIKSMTTSAPLVISIKGTPNRQGYEAVRQYTEQTTFTGRNGLYVGATNLTFTTVTRCCSGASQKTTWAINSGSVTVINNQ